MCSSSWFWGRKVRNGTNKSLKVYPFVLFTLAGTWKTWPYLTTCSPFLPPQFLIIETNKTVFNQIHGPYKPKSDPKGHNIVIINLHRPPITITVMGQTKKKLLSEEEGQRLASPAVTYQCQKPKSTLPLQCLIKNIHLDPISASCSLRSPALILNATYRLINLLHFDKSFCHDQILSCSMITWFLVSIRLRSPLAFQGHPHPHINLN